MATSKILLVTDSYPPLQGGATRDTHLLARELARRGRDVSVATPWQPGLAHGEKIDGIPVHRIKGIPARIPWFSKDPNERHHPPFPDPLAVWDLHRLLTRLNPDIVHAYGWVTYSCAAALIGKKIPLLVSARDYGYICPIRTLVRQSENGQQPCPGPDLASCQSCATRFYGSPLKAAVAVAGVFGGRTLLKRTMHGLHSCSAYVASTMRQQLLQRRVPPIESSARTLAEASIVSFRDDTVDETPDDSILAQLPREPFILFVGGLRDCKGVRELLAAYQELRAAPPLVLIGYPTPESPTHYPEGVTVLHNVPHGTVMVAWERALFGVAPSVWPEPLGNVVHEAMSRGKAVVGTRPGGMTDMIVDGETGLLVPAGDVEALREAMRRLIVDDGLRARLGNAARQRARRFSPDRLMPAFLDLYDQVRSVHLASTIDQNHSLRTIPATSLMERFRRLLWRLGIGKRVSAQRASKRIRSLTAVVNPAPVILLGNQKSGTTAIAALLAEHANRTVTLDIMGIVEPVQTMLHTGEVPFRTFVRRNAFDFSRDIIKEPCLTFLYPALKDVFPDAKYVMIVRDPRSNIRSILNLYDIPGDLPDFDVAAARGLSADWKRILDNRWLGLPDGTYIESLAWRWNAAADVYFENPDDMILIRYEDFLGDRAGSIATLARQLSVRGAVDITGSVHRQYQPRGDRSVAWLEFFGERNLTRIEAVCGDRMRRLGYAPAAERAAAV